MKYFYERVLEPILIPLVALGVIAFGAVNVSRLFLATAHGDRAVIVATLISVLILAGAIVATSLEKIDRGVMLGGAVVVGLALSVAGLIAEEVDLDYIADHDKDPSGEGFTSEIEIVAIDIDFPVKQVEAANGGGIKVNLVNEGAGLHNFVVEGLEETTKVEAAGGATASEVIALDPGDYIFYCDVPGHRAAGMEGNLTVVEGEGPAEGGAGAGEVVTVPAEDITFPVKEFAAPAGEVAFEYVNNGAIFHNLVVEGFEDDMLVEANGGETGRGSLALEPGVYTLYCAIPGHRSAGMEGTLTVS